MPCCWLNSRYPPQNQRWLSLSEWLQIFSIAGYQADLRYIQWISQNLDGLMRLAPYMEQNIRLNEKYTNEWNAIPVFDYRDRKKLKSYIRQRWRCDRFGRKQVSPLQPVCLLAATPPVLPRALQGLPVWPHPRWPTGRSAASQCGCGHPHLRPFGHPPRKDGAVPGEHFPGEDSNGNAVFDVTFQ